MFRMAETCVVGTLKAFNWLPLTMTTSNHCGGRQYSSGTSVESPAGADRINRFLYEHKGTYT